MSFFDYVRAITKGLLFITMVIAFVMIGNASVLRNRPLLLSSSSSFTPSSSAITSGSSTTTITTITSTEEAAVIAQNKTNNRRSSMSSTTNRSRSGSSSSRIWRFRTPEETEYCKQPRRRIHHFCPANTSLSSSSVSSKIIVACDDYLGYDPTMTKVFAPPPLSINEASTSLSSLGTSWSSEEDMSVCGLDVRRCLARYIRMHDLFDESSITALSTSTTTGDEHHPSSSSDDGTEASTSTSSPPPPLLSIHMLVVGNSHARDLHYFVAEAFGAQGKRKHFVKNFVTHSEMIIALPMRRISSAGRGRGEHDNNGLDDNGVNVSATEKRNRSETSLVRRDRRRRLVNVNLTLTYLEAIYNFKQHIEALDDLFPFIADLNFSLIVVSRGAWDTRRNAVAPLLLQAQFERTFLDVVARWPHTLHVVIKPVHFVHLLRNVPPRTSETALRRKYYDSYMNYVCNAVPRVLLLRNVTLCAAHRALQKLNRIDSGGVGESVVADDDHRRSNSTGSTSSHDLKTTTQSNNNLNTTRLEVDMTKRTKRRYVFTWLDTFDETAQQRDLSGTHGHHYKPPASSSHVNRFMSQHVCPTSDATTAGVRLGGGFGDDEEAAAISFAVGEAACAVVANANASYVEDRRCTCHSAYRSDPCDLKFQGRVRSLAF